MHVDNMKQILQDLKMIFSERGRYDERGFFVTECPFCGAANGLSLASGASRAGGVCAVCGVRVQVRR